jgi:hypothetical protein
MRVRVLIFILLAAAMAVWFFLTARPTNGPQPEVSAPEAAKQEAAPQAVAAFEPFIGPRPGGLTVIPGTVSAEPPPEAGAD